MKTMLFTVTCACVGALFAGGLPESMRVYPTPQEVVTTGGDFATPAEIALSPAEGFDADAKAVLARSFRFAPEAPFAVTWKVEAGLPKEGYTLTLRGNGAELTAADGTGFFYAAQTLRQLLAADRFTGVTVKDWPSVPFRGTVEGFYGQPWSFEARKSQFRFYGDWKLNTYIYGPKDDPFHGFSNRWREPYPEAEAKRLAELVKVAHENKVNFVWAVHPGRDIQWKDDSDMKACVAKFERMYALGVRSFAVFFDDIGGEGARAEKQVELLNYVNRNFVRVKKDVTPLLLCPTQYNQAWSGGPYLDILGKGLDADIMVMWTGRSVCTDITKPSMEWINAKLGRKAYIWWNWPVSDYCRSHLLLGKAYGNDKANGPLYAGFVSNPMDKPEASKIGLFGVADYTWNPEAYDADRAWRDGIRRLFPANAAAVQTFADHNSDQGPNGHGYRREESVAIAPAVERATAALKEGKPLAKEDAEAIAAEFARMAAAGEAVLKDKSNPLFHDEVSDWADLFARFGATGKSVHDALAGALPAEAALGRLLAYRADHAAISKRHASKPFQTPIVVASRVMAPYVDRCGEALYDRLWRETAGKPAPKTAAKIYELITNVEALKTLRVERAGAFVRLPKVHEPKTLAPGEWIGIRLPDGVTATWVHFVLDSADAPKQGRVQLSTDGGKTWGERATVVRGNGQEGEMEVRRINAKDGVNAARYINVSDKPVTVTLRQFKVDVPADATANVFGAMTDGDLASGYTLAPKQSVRVPLTAPVTEKNTKVLASGAVTVRLEAEAAVLTAGENAVTIHEVIH